DRRCRCALARLSHSPHRHAGDAAAGMGGNCRGAPVAHAVNYFASQPRISPPRFAMVCTLTYQRPAMRSAACASVSVAEPLAGLMGLLAIRIATGAFLPTSAGPWK